MNFKIDIVSDLVCPWCFVGKRRLAEAVAQVAERHPRFSPEYRWWPYFLNPATSVKGEPYQEFMLAKFGDEAALQTMQQRVSEAGRVSGVEFDFSRITVRPNTLRAHRLIHRAQVAGQPVELVWQLVERLFVAFFQQGRDIGDIDQLAEMAAASGDAYDSRSAVIDYLHGEEGLLQVIALNEQALSWGVSGVPFFGFADQTGVSGAQPVETLVAAIETLL